MTIEALLFTLSCLGIAETVYLVKKRWISEKPFCPIGGDNCKVVLESKYNKMFLFHNDMWGLLFYITCSIIASFFVIGVEPLLLWENIFKILIALGSLFSAYLTYLQYKVIKAWCFWCLMSALTIWLMGAIILLSNI